MAKGKETILIVDDEKDVRKLLRQRLKNEGYRCKEAGNADEALTCLGDGSADIVLLDIKMPGKSRKELLPEIKKHYPDTVVITATDTSNVDTAIESLKHGAYDYVTKPFNLDEVVHSVKRAMEKIRLELEPRNYQQLEQMIEEQAKEIRETFLGAMAALSFALEAKDSYTAGHSRRVTEIAVAIGKKLALSDDELEDLRWGSSLHDIGKIAVDQGIMNKPGKLTEEEYEHVMTHTTVGTSIVAPVVRNKRITEIVEHHHAHYDGSGLNQKLKGEDIPLLARIVAVADAYDAMTSTRPYRLAWSREQALAEIKWEMGRQFDPIVANAFLEMSASDMGTEKRKILIADAEDGVRLMARNVLSDNYTIIEASDGEEAVEVAKNQEPDLILMDILMPKKDGLQACYEIKTNLPTKTIPVVMLSALNHNLERKISAKLGAEDYMTKPFSPEALLEAVNHFLANHPEEKHDISPLVTVNGLIG